MAVTNGGDRSTLTALLSFAFCYAVYRSSARIGAVDVPDFKRKLNTVPVPHLGGIGFFLAFYCVLIIKRLILQTLPPLDSALMICGGLTLMLGSADDLLDLPAAVKLLIQTVIATVGAIIIFPEATAAPTLIRAAYTVLLINAFNLIDGLDGLCAGISISALFFFCLSDLLFLNTGMGFSALLLLFSIIGFLPLNAYPARLYMGDSGSETLGLSIALLSLGYGDAGLSVSPAFFLIPIADTVLSVARRLLHGRSPFSADKEHLHHKLLAFGVSHPASVNLLLILSVLLSAVSVTAYLLFSGLK